MHPNELNHPVERRADRRYKTSFRVHWGREQGFTAEGEVSDLSAGGCFVIADEQVNEADLVSLCVEVPGHGALTLLGTVAFWVADTGFGVRFAPYSQGGALDRLAVIVDALDRR